MVNIVVLIGRLGKEPEIRYTPSGTPVATLRLATDRKWRDKNGNLKEETTWHTVVVMGKQAEVASSYLKKGSLIFVEGRLRTRSWDDKDGNRHTVTEILARNFRFLDKKEAPELPAEEFVEEPTEPEIEPGISSTSVEDDIPF